MKYLLLPLIIVPLLTSTAVAENNCYKAILGKMVLPLCDSFSETTRKLLKKGFDLKIQQDSYGSYGDTSFANFENDTINIHIAAFKEKIYAMEIYKKYYIKPNYTGILKQLIARNHSQKPLLHSNYVRASFYHWKEWCWGECTYNQGYHYAYGDKPLNYKQDSSHYMAFKYLHTPSDGLYEIHIELRNQKTANASKKAYQQYNKSEEEKTRNEF
ncbi:hypothetical protein [Phocoenobacter skyensis]|uniref:Uncharacterized protein n=1 Tax=Phocoenobacter skyensis TaxID=97481 RepID=A0A1H7Y2J2_9PAST|nr:hypothetical protein [Pasteurella skyensis]MDP8079775.1 hypothetical protein [Pasteurella skyensis]MDP8085756.1 hypothetical protein [Pasteurella skyensis]MDP8185584.1 hypothetical protein [Pasteurella skyensis]QLB21840.1 hypothetical protein A6B44_00890 [Pasteurella skyensis]SEM39557.1 hypothetical protein SAMN05444853_11548 [Pasteurella skyensis]